MKIATRLILLLVMAVMAVMGAYALVTISRSQDRLDEEVLKMADHVSLALTVGVLHHLEEGDVDDVENVLETVTHHEDVIGAAVYDPEGRLITASSSIRSQVKDPFPTIMQDDGRGWYDQSDEGDRLYSYIRAVRAVDGQVLGAMKLVLGQKSLMPFVVEARNFVLGAIFLLTVVLSLLIVVFSQRQIAGPLAELSQGAEIIGQGRLDYRIEGRQRGEIGILSAAFNQMASNLQTATQEIIAEREYIRSIVDSIVEGVLVIDRQQRITVWNRTMAQRSGIPLEQVLGKRLLEVLPDLSSYDLESAIAEILEGERADLELSVEGMKQQPERLLVITGAPVKDSKGQTVGIVLVLTDVTERARLEQRILQSEKLAAVGQLAAGVAHEIGTPLNVISGSAEYLLMDLAEDGHGREELGTIVSEANRITQLLKQLMAFARPDKPKVESIDAAQVVESVLVLLRRQIERQGIEIRIDLEPDMDPIHGDGNQIQQVFLNLIVNAWQAMPDGGTLEICGRNAVTEGEEADRWVEVRIEDTGSGIPREHRTKIFEPFFTTKDVGQGTGLGLAVSQRIVENHGGRIEVSDRENQGSCFSVLLPA